MREYIFAALILCMLFLFAYCSTLQAEEHNKIYTYFYSTEYKDASIAILALAILESGWFKSKYHIKFNNYFSINR